jgi:predicted nucleic acid-binding protein
MPEHFLDSSALLKRYRQETGSRWMLELTAKSDQMTVARLAHVEVTAAIVRRARNLGDSAQDVASALTSLDIDMLRDFQVVEFSDALISRAIVLTKAHALRAADAIQLACALLSRADRPSSTEFYLVSADEELNAAALDEGLRVENPNLHP